MNIGCLYCASNIDPTSTTAKKMLKGTVQWCGNCDSGLIGYYDSWSNEKLASRRSNILGTLLYYGTSAYVVGFCVPPDLNKQIIDDMLVEHHNISRLINIRQQKSVDDAQIVTYV